VRGQGRSYPSGCRTCLSLRRSSKGHVGLSEGQVAFASTQVASLGNTSDSEAARRRCADGDPYAQAAPVRCSLSRRAFGGEPCAPGDAIQARYPIAAAAAYCSGIINRTNEAYMSIESLISRELLRTTADATLSDVATTMISMASGSVLVFDAQELVGVITLRDIVRAALQEPNIAQVLVEKYMTTHPWVVSPDWSVSDIAARMINHGIEHVPVVQDGQVVGILSSLDLVAYLALQGEREADA
jgi:CBS domain-containing protein